MSVGPENHPRWVEIDDGSNLAEVSLYEALSYNQTYENFGGHVVHRMLDGTGVKQNNWGKIRTTLSGSGGMPLSFRSINYNGALTLKCGVPRSIQSTSNVIAIPAARRADTGYLPQGFKRVAGFWLPSPVNVVVNTATVTIDPSATHYKVDFYPELPVFMNDPSETYNWDNVNTSWSITAEEI